MNHSKPVDARPTLTRNVAPGIHRLSHAFVNCYIVEAPEGVTVVDTALPATWPMVNKALSAIGRSASDVEAVVLTHAHFDHVGFAARAQSEWGVPVFAHALERYLAAHPYRYAHENPRSIYPIRHPKGLPVIAAMVGAGALRVKGVLDVFELEVGVELDVPGHPIPVFSPGHTYGHCALHFADRSALLTGDALVTFNPYTGGYGPQIVSGAATADSAENLISLAILADTEAQIVLPGHGRSWTRGARLAAQLAFDHGPS